MLHDSRGVRWDSDHVVTWNDELLHIVEEIVFNGYEEKVKIGLDYFDASINRIAAWVIGLRNTRKAILNACLKPINLAIDAEVNGDFTSRLAILEESKSLPFAAVWDYYCLLKGVYVGSTWIDSVKKYEREVLLSR